jgi:hypothetical protein
MHGRMQGHERSSDPERAYIMVMGCSLLVAAQAFRGTPQAGQVVYEKNRLRCQGEKLDGAGTEGQYLIVQPPGYHLARENWLGSLDHDLA